MEASLKVMSEWSYRGGQFNGGENGHVTGGHFNEGRIVMLQKVA